MLFIYFYIVVKTYVNAKKIIENEKKIDIIIYYVFNYIYIYVRMYYIFRNGYYVVVFVKLTKIEDDQMVNLST